MQRHAFSLIKKSVLISNSLHYLCINCHFHSQYLLPVNWTKLSLSYISTIKQDEFLKTKQIKIPKKKQKQNGEYKRTWLLQAREVRFKLSFLVGSEMVGWFSLIGILIIVLIIAKTISASTWRFHFFNLKTKIHQVNLPKIEPGDAKDWCDYQVNCFFSIMQWQMIGDNLLVQLMKYIFQMCDFLAVYVRWLFATLCIFTPFAI